MFRVAELLELARLIEELKKLKQREKCKGNNVANCKGNDVDRAGARLMKISRMEAKK